MNPRHTSPPPISLSTMRWLWIGGLAVILFMAGLLFWPQHATPTVQAKSSYLAQFISTYPQVAGTRLDSCNTCHTSVPARNPYGADFKSHGHNFQAIEQLDSDGDGYTNLQEIQALTLPGDPNSHPGGTQPNPTATPAPSVTPNPPPSDGQYQLIGWNDLGMHCMNESFANLAILPPYNTLWAQLIRTGPQPQVVTDNVVIEYHFRNNTTSAGKTDFWQYANQLFGVSLPQDVGLTGARLQGTMRAEGDHFIVEGVPLTPYEDGSHTQQPYQLAELVAKDASTGQVLATTTFVAPVSTEMHCDDCHADGMREGIATGNVETNILALHDREEGTNLMAQRPVLCANCHGSNALGMPGKPWIPNLSRAIHHKHAGGDDEGGEGGEGGDCDDDGIPNSVDPTDGCEEDGRSLSTMPAGIAQATEARAQCYQCHPGPQTKCLRGTMAAAGMTCQDCHGSMNDVANKNRRPWIDLPRCGNCHGPQYAEEPGKLYRQSKGHGGLYCESCHGSPHAILPSTEGRDNLQVTRLQGYPGILRECTVCHGSNVPAGPGPHGMANPHPTATPTPPPTATPTPPPPPTATPTPTSPPPATATPMPTATPTAPPQPTATPAAGQVQLWLDPAQRTVSPQATFTLDLKAQPEAIAGYEVTLRFDPQVVHAQTATLGNWLQGSDRTVTPLGPIIDNQGGVIRFGAFSFGSNPPPTGESWLARFTFQAVAAGDTQVRFESAKLTNATGQPYPDVQTRDAQVHVQTLIGDLNGDCVVDITDIMMVASHWGAQAGQPGWDPAMDLDGNGVIDIADIMIVASHWGETCNSATGNKTSQAPQQALPGLEVAGPARLRFEPRRGQATLGSGTYQVDLVMDDAQNLASFETTIRFDPQRLQLEQVVWSNWLSSTGRQVIPLGPTIDNGSGRAHLGAISFGSQAGVSGHGVLATLRFRPRASGESDLVLEDAKSTDPQGTRLDMITESGSVRIASQAALYLPMLR